MSLSDTDTYSATIPTQTDDTEIEYYLTATDNNQKSISKPYVAANAPYNYKIVEYGSIIDADSLYNQAFFPCFPDSSAFQQTTIYFNDTVALSTDPLSDDSLANLGLNPGEYAYSLTSTDIAGEVNGTIEVDNRYLDTINLMANPIEFYSDMEITINDSIFVADSTGMIYAFEGTYDYMVTHPSMVDTAYATLTVTENSYGNDYINYIPSKQNDFYQLLVLADSLPFTDAWFYKEKYPDGTSYVEILEDGYVYFSTAGTYNYEVYNDGVSVIDTLEI
jgi:hypothetical protein